jgi:hypothetical protein
MMMIAKGGIYLGSGIDSQSFCHRDLSSTAAQMIGFNAADTTARSGSFWHYRLRQPNQPSKPCAINSNDMINCNDTIHTFANARSTYRFNAGGQSLGEEPAEADDEDDEVVVVVVLAVGLCGAAEDRV